MAVKKMTKKTVARKSTPRTTGDLLRDTWASTLESLTQAEAEVEKQVKALIKKNKLTPAEASALIKKIGTRVEKQRKKALGELETRLKGVQARIKKERKNAAKMIEEAVRATLATFNIPSREEVAELTRKVDELSKKIDALKR